MEAPRRGRENLLPGDRVLIFLTVGTQGPFDRLVRTVDEWIGAHPEIEAFGQIGDAEYRPANFETTEWMDPAGFDRRLADCELVVAHAGMGTILTALENARPIVILPRRAAFGEHRNDHQVDTAKKFGAQPGITAAFSEDELKLALDQRSAAPGEALSPIASSELLSGLREFLRTVPRRRRRR